MECLEGMRTDFDNAEYERWPNPGACCIITRLLKEAVSEGSESQGGTTISSCMTIVQGQTQQELHVGACSACHRAS